MESAALQLARQESVTSTGQSPGQVAVLIAYLGSIFLWLNAEIATRRSSKKGSYSHLDDEERSITISVSAKGNGSATPVAAPEAPGGLRKVVLLDPEALVSALPSLRALVEFGTILLWFYVADRTATFPQGTKLYSRDVLAFLFCILTLVAWITSNKPGRGTVLLNRPQTEEWKGWMQVLFLLYHYFEAREMYNAIRVFIAGYVWMTGYNNFSYYYKYKDFNIARFCQMMWRLNFLVAAVCVVLRNSYMLYYICPMHTIFTIMVYAALGLGRPLNESTWGVLVKFVLCTGVVFVCWDVRPIFNLVWGTPPLRWLMEYVDPRHPSNDPLHEWYFRSSLDRYVWIHGMACAFLHPVAEGWLKQLDSLPVRLRMASRALLAACALAVLGVWGRLVYLQPKARYNQLHPYTSWIPITAFIVLRNLTPGMRLSALALYGWLGKITLETYISQFHTWLLTGVPDGQPKMLLTFFPAEYPLLNFAATTTVYVFVSYRLFLLTDSLRHMVIPDKVPGSVLIRNSGKAAACAASLYAVGAGVLYFVPASQGQPLAAFASKDVGTQWHP